MNEIFPAATPSHIRIIGDLFREYEQVLQVDLCFQGFEEELAGLPGKYAPPQGALLLAFAAGRPAGCVAMRPLSPGVCEMKRLYVRPAHAGRGLGRQLALAVIERAVAAGYTRMRLDTLERLRPALGLYAGLGFRRCAPYYQNPLPGVVYLERDL
ncbi:N-acetyltransferase [Desulfosarcina alkanivorans]|uniref:N-acetyltransferase n=1 Tax=Desulfosarcina alkanivorans TaxID=571177 RepID=A0A5K7YMB4_9BACT|nr:GNAT family N-acetyltransferase [Desulfosarcina alkanivorans]BBO70882.1 N-acetyltransferase [Desulfosarcina alkanivorans]